MLNTDFSNVTFSRLETYIVTQPEQSNAMGNVHGGELMKILDNVGGLAAYKHAKNPVVTARVDDVVFYRPVHIGNVLRCVGQLVYVGSSSLLVYVTINIQNVKENSEWLALSGYITMVNVNIVDGKSVVAPKLEAKTKEDQELLKLGEKKYAEIKSKLNR